MHTAEYLGTNLTQPLYTSNIPTRHPMSLSESSPRRTQVEVVCVREELGQVEELGDEFAHVRHVVLRRRAPRVLHAVEHPVRQIKMAALRGNGQLPVSVGNFRWAWVTSGQRRKLPVSVGDFQTLRGQLPDSMVDFQCEKLQDSVRNLRAAWETSGGGERGKLVALSSPAMARGLGALFVSVNMR